MGITSEQLAELKELAERATQGEWPYNENWLWCTDDGFHHWKICQYGDCQFMSAANPQTVLALIAEIERLRAIAGEGE